MKTLKNLERLQHLHEMIKAENTGTPGELSEKMNISERLVYNLLEQLKDLEASICYSRKSKTYYYCKDFQLNVNISVSVISNNELTEIFAGSYFLQEKNSLQGLCGDQKYISNIKTKICA
ncbi:HTH domain-containing protein [Zunongwangia sp. F363]|uniref:HTH domain-containing protein n=1 Tax=Autumnicola tepida TaxID=3075595 RepID=A0ABU3C820_9FLAO|nr:HTH domain-containing protein [Zunongwangia sp. F363]MDT0642220.1 HTH domain-containing protein [Zunongwangia sp. F363]